MTKKNLSFTAQQARRQLMQAGPKARVVVQVAYDLILPIYEFRVEQDRIVIVPDLEADALVNINDASTSVQLPGESKVETPDDGGLRITTEADAHGTESDVEHEET